MTEYRGDKRVFNEHCRSDLQDAPMTEPPRPPKTLTPARLEGLRRVLNETATEGDVDELFQHIDAISAALQEARAERDWQPIETAPKDGRYMLLMWPHWSPRHAIIGRWFCGEWDAIWRLEGDRDDPSPTHWMPLPDPTEEPSR